MDKVLVLMSTYNGERFLEEQLISIINQSNIDVYLLVRDDGSTDSTVDILHRYESLFSKKIEIIEGENIGWKQSFMYLIKYASINYKHIGFFAFSDQDDIWLDKKLYRAVALLGHNINCPLLYFSNMNYYKNGRDYGKIRHYTPVPTIKNCLVRNYATGCTIVFTNGLLELLTIGYPNTPTPHDSWVYRVAMLCGSVIVDDNSYILYRQHDNNQVGSKRTIIDIWKRRIKSIPFALKNHTLEYIAKELLRIYGSVMSPSSKEAVRKLAEYNNNLSSRFALFTDRAYSLEEKSDFWLRIKIILGII